MELPTDGTLLLPSSTPVKLLKEQLITALCLRILNIPNPPSASSLATAFPSTRIAILFSGGLDCTVLARLCHDLLPEDHAVDLVNVAFENPRVASQLQKQANGAMIDVYEACPDRVTGRKAFAELRKVCPGRTFRFISVSFESGDGMMNRADASTGQRAIYGNVLPSCTSDFFDASSQHGDGPFHCVRTVLCSARPRLVSRAGRLSLAAGAVLHACSGSAVGVGCR